MIYYSMTCKRLWEGRDDPRRTSRPAPVRCDAALKGTAPCRIEGADRGNNKDGRALQNCDTTRIHSFDSASTSRPEKPLVRVKPQASGRPVPFGDARSNNPTSNAKASVMPVRRTKPSQPKSKKAHARMITPRAAAMSARRTRSVPLFFRANPE